MNYLGLSVTDEISGFTGIVTGQVEYITGGNQVLISPKTKEGSNLIEAKWFDEQRIEIHQEKGKLILREMPDESVKAVGFDKEPHK